MFPSSVLSPSPFTHVPSPLPLSHILSCLLSPLLSSSQHLPPYLAICLLNTSSPSASLLFSLPLPHIIIIICHKTNSEHNIPTAGCPLLADTSPRSRGSPTVTDLFLSPSEYSPGHCWKNGFVISDSCILYYLGYPLFKLFAIVQHYNLEQGVLLPSFTAPIVAFLKR